jgi:hypothetical protein
MELLTQLPLTIKIGWIVLAAWSIAQVIWYTRLETSPAPPPAWRADPPASHRAARTTFTTVLPTGGSPEFLAELGLDDPEPTSSRESAYH